MVVVFRWLVPVVTGITKDLAYDTFSEQEIKDIDERYWAFAVPAEND